MANEGLTQTQPVASQVAMRAVQSVSDESRGVQARLISTVNWWWKFNLLESMEEVIIGRHPECQIVVEDKRCSGRHVRIFRDDGFHYFLESLSNNPCFVNDSMLRKGDTRAMQHGDEISICVHAHNQEEKPFAAYVFRRVGQGHDSWPSCKSDEACSVNGSTLNADHVQSGRNFRSDQWIQEQWDMRTVLGSGKFSEVRLGVKIKTGARFAVKVINKKEFLTFQTKRQSHLSLSSEAEVLTRLDHPHIVKFYEWFETDVNLYLVMEFLASDLLHFILERGCFPEPFARRLFRELCEAVKYLHEKNIVHRDLKPENILLTHRSEAGHLKVADFGLARTNMQSRDCRTFCGTPHYFAPEVIGTAQCRSGSGELAGYGLPVDMWSVGVILYVMLSGAPPFEEERLYEQIQEGRYEFDVPEFDAVSPEVKELIRNLMTVNPKARLTIQETLAHRWLRQWDPTVRSAPGVAEPGTKRRRGEPVTDFQDSMFSGSMFSGF